MPDSQTYQWSGIDQQGNRLNGTFEAIDLSDAHAILRKMKIEVISLEPKPLSALNRIKTLTKRKKIKTREILLFTRFLSTMLSAGLPIVQSLEIVKEDQDNAAMKDLLNDIKKNIEGGKGLAESFNVHSQFFDKLYINLIKAGEQSGTLDKTLKRLAAYMEKTESLRRKIKKAMIYPLAILTVALIVSLVLLIFVVPQFQTMFKSFGADLPAFSLMIVRLSDFIRSYWWVLLLFIFASPILIRTILKRYEHLYYVIDRISLKITIMGPLLRKAIIARFTRTLATTIEAGLPFTDSIRAMAPIMGNRLYEDAVMKIGDDVTSGRQLSVSMASTKLFPNMAIQMVAVGEASGALADMLNKIADYYEEEVNSTVDNLSSLLEPLIMLVLGVIIGGFVIAMYLPIFKLGSLF